MTKPRCSLCCKAGHNKRSCPQKKSRKIRRKKNKPPILASLEKISGFEDKLVKDQKKLQKAQDEHLERLESLPTEEWDDIYTDIFGQVWDQVADFAIDLGAGQDAAADAADIIANSVIRRLSGEF